MDISRLVHSLESDEIDALLRLYYNREGVVKNFTNSDFKEEILQDLIDKNLISTSIDEDASVVSLTEDGLSVCGSVMFDRINENKELFKQRIQDLPGRAISTLINRVMWRDVVTKESGSIDPIIKPYSLNNSLWYERVLLKDGRIGKILEVLYGVLGDLGFIENVDGEQLCSPEVESFLRDEYKDIMNLTWNEEDSLKYYYFFYVYAQEQKNLINFSGGGEEYRSMFFEEGGGLTDYWFSSNQSEPHMLLNSLGVSEKRIMDFLGEMQTKGIVSERYYPLSSFSFFRNDDKIFVIMDIKRYMSYITGKLMTPVVDSLLG